MKSNIIKAAINLGCIPGTKILEFYKEIGRDCADVNEAAFDYIQDIFAGTVREEDAATRAKKLKMTFDPDAEDYPTMAVGGGDGDGEGEGGGDGSDDEGGDDGWTSAS